MTAPDVQILLVEDDEIEAEAIGRALEKHGLAHRCVAARDGDEALSVLRSADPQALAQSPFLILLDLNLPGMNGLEFLRELRAEPALSASVVFVITTSDDDRDKRAAYQYNVAGYLVKSKLGDSFIQLAKLIEFYSECVEFPAPARLEAIHS